jgi:hypothetical protein
MRMRAAGVAPEAGPGVLPRAPLREQHAAVRIEQEDRKGPVESQRVAMAIGLGCRADLPVLAVYEDECFL